MTGKNLGSPKLRTGGNCSVSLRQNFLAQGTTRGFSFHKVFVIKRLGVEIAPKIAGNKWEYAGKAGNKWEIVALEMQILECRLQKEWRGQDIGQYAMLP
jgi:hypothetical protein